MSLKICAGKFAKKDPIATVGLTDFSPLLTKYSINDLIKSDVLSGTVRTVDECQVFISKSDLFGLNSPRGLLGNSYSDFCTPPDTPASASPPQSRNISQTGSTISSSGNGFFPPRVNRSTSHSDYGSGSGSPAVEHLRALSNSPSHSNSPDESSDSSAISSPDGSLNNLFNSMTHDDIYSLSRQHKIRQLQQQQQQQQKQQQLQQQLQQQQYHQQDNTLNNGSLDEHVGYNRQALQELYLQQQVQLLEQWNSNSSLLRNNNNGFSGVGNSSPIGSSIGGGVSNGGGGGGSCPSFSRSTSYAADGGGWNTPQMLNGCGTQYTPSLNSPLNSSLTSSLNSVLPTLENMYLERVARFHRSAASVYEATCTWSGVLPERLGEPIGYSSKVFLGGLPWDINEQTLIQAFKQFGTIRVEWPGKEKQASQPKGYVYAIFESEKNVKFLLQNCCRSSGNGSWYYTLPSKRSKNKDVEVIPWVLNDSNHTKSTSQKLDPTKTVFVGALHGMLNADGLAKIMNDLFDGVVYAGIDTDKYKYPIGSGRVTFSNSRSYMKAVCAAFIDVKATKFSKKIQVDPYLEDSLCSVCAVQQGPYFCRDMACFRYFCRTCWNFQHPYELRHHKPMMRNSKNNALNNNVNNNCHNNNNNNNYHNNNNNNNCNNNNNIGIVGSASTSSASGTAYSPFGVPTTAAPTRLKFTTAIGSGISECWGPDSDGSDSSKSSSSGDSVVVGGVVAAAVPTGGRLVLGNNAMMTSSVAVGSGVKGKDF